MGELIARIGWKKIVGIIASAGIKIALDLLTEDAKMKSFEKASLKFFEAHFDDLNFTNKDSI